LLATRAVDRQRDLALGSLGLQDVDEDLLAYAHLAHGIGAHRMHLALGHDAFRLEADIDQDTVPLEAHHGAFDDFAAAELSGFRKVAFFEKRRHIFDLGAGGCGLVRQVLSASEWIALRRPRSWRAEAW